MKISLLLSCLPLLAALPAVKNANINKTVYYTQSDIQMTSSSVDLDLYSTYQASVSNEILNELVVWSCSNTDVAYVDANGLITSIDIGTATITASYGKLSSTLSLNVYNSYNAPYINLNKNDIKLSAGDVFNMTAELMFKNEVANDASIKWESNNPSVVNVVGGNTNAKLNAFAPGKARITAYTTYHGVYVSSVVDVEVIQDVYAIGLTGEGLSLINGQYYCTLAKDATVETSPIAYFNGATKGMSITWSTEDASIAYANIDGIIFGVKAGETVVYGNLAGKTTVSIIVTVTE